MTQSSAYSEQQARGAGLTLCDLGLSSWSPVAVAALQRRIGAQPDGLLGPRTIALWRAAQAVVTGGAMPSLEVIDDPRWRGSSRWGASATMVVLHESVTRTWRGAVDVLTRRGLSVHYTVDETGQARQHAPEHRACAHAGSPYNRRSIAVEVVNRYYGAHALPHEQTIQAVWAHKGIYILPTHAQLEAVWLLVEGVCERNPGIPPAYPGDRGAFRWGRLAGVKTGVSAHHRWAHSDALVPEHYCRARHAGLAPDDAWRVTVAAASAGLRVTPCPWETGS